MKAEFLRYLDTDCILTLEGSTKKAVIDEIIAFATTRCTLDESQLRELIWKREKMMTTGVGKGLALPHIRVPGFPIPLVVIGICKNPITDYSSIDNEPIRLIVFVAAEERDQDGYIKLLGSVSSKLKEPDVVDKIFEVKTNKKKVLQVLSQEEE